MSINLPSGITSIGRSAFDGCSSLKSINLPSGLTSIEEWTFNGCSSLTGIELPSGITSIGGHAFTLIVFRSPKQPKLFRNNQT